MIMMMITSTMTVLMNMMMVIMVMMMMMMMNIMNEGASRAQASPAIPCTSEPKSRAQARRLPCKMCLQISRNMQGIARYGKEWHGIE